MPPQEQKKSPPVLSSGCLSLFGLLFLLFAVGMAVSIFSNFHGSFAARAFILLVLAVFAAVGIAIMIAARKAQGEETMRRLLEISFSTFMATLLWR